MQFRMIPHYLFNSLNSINALIQKNPKNASRAIILLSKNYRFMMELANSELILLKDEWKFMENYLELENLKFKDELAVRMLRPQNFPELYIPPYTLQPIVENSFKHGFDLSKKNCEIKVECKPIDLGVILTFEDNGSGNKKSVHLDRSLGNIMERLKFFYEDVSLQIEDRENKGITIQLKFLKRKV